MFNKKRRTDLKDLKKLMIDTGIIKKSAWEHNPVEYQVETVSVTEYDDYEMSISVHAALQTLINHLDLKFKTDSKASTGYTIVNKRAKKQ